MTTESLSNRTFPAALSHNPSHLSAGNQVPEAPNISFLDDRQFWEDIRSPKTPGLWRNFLSASITCLEHLLLSPTPQQREMMPRLVKSRFDETLVKFARKQTELAEQLTFSVGQDVPVLGSVSYDGNGNAVQSVEYRSSGVIFKVLPNVYEQKVVLDINQELSNFVRTETGVDGSPTLTKRELNTSVSVADNEVIVLGGLAEFKDNNGRSGFSFLPEFMRWNTSSRQRSEIVLVVQVQRL